MKKALSILLALAMLFAVTACSNNQQGELPKDDQKQAAGTASKLYLYPFGGYALPGARIPMTVKAADSSYMAAAVPTNVTFGGTNVTQTSGSTVTVEPGARGAATVTATAGSLRANATFTIPTAPTSITIKHVIIS